MRSVMSASDILEIRNVIFFRARERYIHGGIYRAPNRVTAICHGHAHAVVPFTVTDTAIKPIWVMSAAIATCSDLGFPRRLTRTRTDREASSCHRWRRL
jgi:hypothetical protein